MTHDPGGVLACAWWLAFPVRAVLGVWFLWAGLRWLVKASLSRGQQ